jgi:predicted metalloprotease
MEWEGREESSNVEDRRGIHPGVAVGGGIGIVGLIIALILGIDPGNFIGGQQQVANRAGEERQAKFTRVVLKDTEIVWGEQFQKMGKRYPEPTLVLFHDQVDSACGRAGAEVGPFYCPGDSKVYIDLAFYDTLEQELGAHGDFARAYVIAHEVGHHVQRLLGYSKKVDDAHRTGSKTDANRMSVRLELQADYLAGVWAHYAQERFHYLNDKDIQSATDAAFRIGDDVLQKRARGRVTPDSFTHGTARQRQRWFMDGYKTGDVKAASRLFDFRYEDL